MGKFLCANGGERLFILIAKKNQLIAEQTEPVTNGSVNVYSAQFRFSEEWTGLTRTVIFKAGEASKAIILDETGRCNIPKEVLIRNGVWLMVGVKGTRGSELVMPTIWVSLGNIREGVRTCQETESPSVGGTTDHGELSNRDSKDQHPIGAITGLEDELLRIPVPMTADELQKILNGGNQHE